MLLLWEEEEEEAEALVLEVARRVEAAGGKDFPFPFHNSHLSP